MEERPAKPGLAAGRVSPHESNGGEEGPTVQELSSGRGLVSRAWFNRRVLSPML